MKKENLLTYLEQQLEKKLGEYDFALDWNTQAHTIEILVVLYAQNQSNQAIEDSLGTQSVEEIIEFEDSLLLFDQTKGASEIEDYLTTIPYAGKKGLTKKMINGIATYLQVVLTEGESDLLDFLADEEAEVFELRWDEEAFQKCLIESTGPDVYVPYPNY